jgi:hypothetical protein
MRRFVARFNYSCTLIGNRPQSLTGHAADRLAANNLKHPADYENFNIILIFFYSF